MSWGVPQKQRFTLGARGPGFFGSVGSLYQGHGDQMVIQQLGWEMSSPHFFPLFFFVLFHSFFPFFCLSPPATQDARWLHGLGAVTAQQAIDNSGTGVSESLPCFSSYGVRGSPDYVN